MDERAAYIVTRYTSGETITSIAKSIGCGRCTVDSALRKAGVTLRPRKEEIKRAWAEKRQYGPISGTAHLRYARDVEIAARGLLLATINATNAERVWKREQGKLELANRAYEESMKTLEEFLRARQTAEGTTDD